MEWGTLLATSLGAVIGVGSTLLTERIRAAGERSDRRETTRHQLYADYLTALARTADDLWALGHDTDRTDLRARAHGLWRGGDAYPLRYHLTITAPASIVTASDACFRTLRDFRDTTGAGAEGGSAEFAEAQERYGQALVTLHNAMRSDLKAE
jgi:hypothetical protein